MIYQFTLVYQQRQAKREMKQQLRRRLSDDDLEMISYIEHEKEIEWEEEGKEFRLYGEMYDIVKTTTTKGKLVLYCINDKKENALIQKYLDHLKQKSTSDKKSRSSSAKLLFNQSPDAIAISTRQVLVHESQMRFWLPLVELEQLTPPPKV
jgi:hypothetical protein